MTDFHSHILPGMDDGSRSLEESLSMLEALGSQGVRAVAATSHFYPDRESTDSFLARRAAALEKLIPALPQESPRVIPGAEVCYYSGISRMEGLDRLCLEGTRILLLEMPIERWSEHTLQELRYLASSGRLQLMIAHIERPAPYQRPQVLEELVRLGVLFQSNASQFLGGLWTRHRALEQLSRGLIHVLGSDCHNLTTRPPRLKAAYEAIARRFGPDYAARMQEFSRELIE